MRRERFPRHRGLAIPDMHNTDMHVRDTRAVMHAGVAN